jgi:VanZ family protein
VPPRTASVSHHNFWGARNHRLLGRRYGECVPELKRLPRIIVLEDFCWGTRQKDKRLGAAICWARLFILGHFVPGEVSEHYQAWLESRTAELVKSGAAVYPFDEHAGQVVHDRANTMPDLVIPERFSVLHGTPLEVPAKPSLSDLQDAVINIMGFVPFGFLVAAYFQEAADYTRGRALLITIVLGLVTSLIIELLQVYLPSRNSSLLDVINNSVGAALGALIPPSLIRWKSFLTYFGWDKAA